MAEAMIVLIISACGPASETPQFDGAVTLIRFDRRPTAPSVMLSISYSSSKWDCSLRMSTSDADVAELIVGPNRVDHCALGVYSPTCSLSAPDCFAELTRIPDAHIKKLRIRDDPLYEIPLTYKANVYVPILGQHEAASCELTETSTCSIHCYNYVH